MYRNNIFLFLTIYNGYFTDGGADGLGTFFPFLISLVLLVCSFIALLLSFFTKHIKYSIVILDLGIFSIVGTLFFFNWEYTSDYEKQLQEDKKWLTTKTYESKETGVRFQHVSGAISQYVNNIPVVEDIIPTVENGILKIPSNNTIYAIPDMVLKKIKPINKTLKEYLSNVLKTSLLEECLLEKGNASNFKNLPKESEIFKIEFSGTNEKCRNLITKYWLPNTKNTPQEIYFISKKQKEESFIIILIQAPILSVPAIAEDINIDNVKSNNIWYHTLSFLP